MGPVNLRIAAVTAARSWWKESGKSFGRCGLAVEEQLNRRALTYGHLCPKVAPQPAFTWIGWAGKLVMRRCSMKFDKRYLILLASVSIAALMICFPAKRVAATEGDKQFITASSLMNGLAPGAVFP